MALQVRLRHALGERVFDLPARNVERPLVVGRARDADLQVPSVTVAGKHCVLFVHDGRWVVQDLGTGAGTYVNGALLEGAAPLSVGDVLTIGGEAKPPTIEVDPAGAEAGRAGTPAEESIPTAIPVAIPVAGALGARVARPAPARGRAAPPPPPAAEPADAWGGNGTGDADTVDWGTSAGNGYADASSAPYVPRRRPQKKGNDAAVVACVVAAVVVVGVVGIVAYNHSKPAPVVVQPKPPPPEEDDTARHHSNIFTTPDAKPRKAPAGQPQRAAPPAPAPDDASSSAAPDPAASVAAAPTGGSPGAAAPASASADSDHAGDPEWDDLTVAVDGQQLGQAILKIDDYARGNPGKNTKDLDKLRAEVMDRLWWQRIDQLWKKRTRLTQDIATADRDLKDETNAEFKATIQKERDPKVLELKRANEILTTEMGYTSADPPDTVSRAGLAKLRGSRNKDLFAAWSRKTEKYVRTHQGQTQWGGDE